MASLSTGKSTIGHIETNDEFRGHFNRRPFQFFHKLAGHSLFTIPRLLELAKETEKNRPDDLYYDTGANVGIGQRWDQMGAKPPVEEALRRIDQSGAWITLHQSQKDPEYGAIFNECMSQFEEFTGVDVNKVMRVKDALIFITSPNRVTPYHIDRECNFLLQIKGQKSIYVFDQHDREILPEDEIERFWTIDNNSAVYKPQFQDRAFSLRLIPGNGIHIPVNAPHWVKNDDNVSISLSVNFTWKDSERANVYRANYFLRKLGMHPHPPGRSAAVDGTKTVVMAASFVPAMQAARSTVRFVRHLRRKAFAN